MDQVGLEVVDDFTEAGNDTEIEAATAIASTNFDAFLGKNRSYWTYGRQGDNNNPKPPVAHGFGEAGEVQRDAAEFEVSDDVQNERKGCSHE